MTNQLMSSQFLSSSSQPAFLLAYVLSIMPYGVGYIAGVSWSQLFWLCSSSLAHGKWWGAAETMGLSWLCMNAAQQLQKHSCVINIVSSTNPRHYFTSNIMQKLNSTSTSSHLRFIPNEGVGCKQKYFHRPKCFPPCFPLLLLFHMRMFPDTPELIY